MTKTIATTIGGVTVSLSVEVAASFWTQLSSDSGHVLSAEESEDLFAHCLLEMPTVHLQAHGAICHSLVSSYAKYLEDNLVE